MSKEIEEVTVVLRACGDYVAFHEMSLYVEYVFGSVEYSEILENVIDDGNTPEEICKLIEEIWEDKKDISTEEQQILDDLVEKFVSNYEGDYCDYAIYSGIMVNNKIYVDI
jgi:hypothetical protein